MNRSVNTFIKNVSDQEIRLLRCLQIKKQLARRLNPFSKFFTKLRPFWNAISSAALGKTAMKQVKEKCCWEINKTHLK